MRRRFAKATNTVALVLAPAFAVVSPACGATLGLADYVQGDPPITHINNTANQIPGNLSGVTYNTVTDTLFTVLNSPERIIELNLDPDSSAQSSLCQSPPPHFFSCYRPSVF